MEIADEGAEEMQEITVALDATRAGAAGRRRGGEKEASETPPAAPATSARVNAIKAS